MDLSTIILIFATVNVIVALYIVWMLGLRDAKKPTKPQILLDTCALIDGRIIAIAQSGFLSQRIAIPQFVIAEMQYLADHGDSHKRERARFGLDVVRELQGMEHTHVSITRDDFANLREVDDKLIALAKRYSAMLYTTDYNLNKVAQIEGVSVLNVNELAHALRPHHLPGEQIDIKIAQVGQDPSQGVGYLEDGTMVVVEQAGRKIGQRLHVEFSRMLQTQAGKMMFATVAGQGKSEKHDAATQPMPKNQPVKPVLQQQRQNWQKPKPIKYQPREPQPNQTTMVQTNGIQKRTSQPEPVAPKHGNQPAGQPKNAPAERDRARRPHQPPQRRTPEDNLFSAIREQRR